MIRARLDNNHGEHGFFVPGLESQEINGTASQRLSEIISDSLITQSDIGEQIREDTDLRDELLSMDRESREELYRDIWIVISQKSQSATARTPEVSLIYKKVTREIEQSLQDI